MSQQCDLLIKSEVCYMSEHIHNKHTYFLFDESNRTTKRGGKNRLH